MADWSSKKKMCVTCGSWGGNRTLTNANFHVRTQGGGASAGECLDRRSGKHKMKVNEQNSCPQFQKWGPLK